VGGTGICGFEKDWAYDRAQLTFDGDKGPLYQDLMNAVEEAKYISQPEFCGFFWKQGAADGTKKILANAYYERFKQLISDLQADLGVPELPTFVPVYANDKDLLKLPIGADGTHYSSEGYITLGEFTASALEEFYSGIDKSPLEVAIQQAETRVNAQAGNIGNQSGQYSQASFDAALNAIALAREALGKDLTRSGLAAAIAALETEMEKFFPILTGANHSSSSTFSIFPNPVSEVLRIRADNLVGIKVVDLSGRVLIQRKLESTCLDVTALQDGIYLIQIIQNDHSTWTGHFVKRKP